MGAVAVAGVHANGPHNYDLTIVSHVEPFDLVKYHRARLLLGYKSEAFNALYKQITDDAERSRPRQAAGRRPAHARDRRGRRLPVPAAMDHDREQEVEGRVEGGPAVRERFLGLVLGIDPVTQVKSDIASFGLSPSEERSFFWLHQNRICKTTPCTVAGASYFNGLRDLLDGLRKSRCHLTRRAKHWHDGIIEEGRAHDPFGSAAPVDPRR